MSKWSNKDDLILSDIVKLYNQKGKKMKQAFQQASNVLNRTPAACESRWYNTLKQIEEVKEFKKNNVMKADIAKSDYSRVLMINEHRKKLDKIIEKRKIDKIDKIDISSGLEDIDKVTFERRHDKVDIPLSEALEEENLDFDEIIALAKSFDELDLVEFNSLTDSKSINDSIDYSLLQKLVNKQEKENKEKQFTKEHTSILKEELKKMIDSLDTETPINNKSLLIVGKYLIDIWFKQQMEK